MLKMSPAELPPPTVLRREPRPLPARRVTRPESGLLVTAALLAGTLFFGAGATVAQPLSFEAALTATTNIPGQDFGLVVAIDGATVVVGAPPETPGINNGSAYVFERGPGGWSDMTEVARLRPSLNDNDDEFGAAVAIEGDTIFVGAPGANGGGVVYVFQRPAGGWADMSETARLTRGTGGSLGSLGKSLSVRGGTIVAMAPSEFHGDDELATGALFVFERPATGVWVDATEDAVLTATMVGSRDRFSGFREGVAYDDGIAVAMIRSDEDRLVVFERTAGGWTQPNEVAKLTVTGSPDLTSSVSIRGDLIVVGARRDDPDGIASQGAVYVFERPGPIWMNMTETAQLRAAVPQSGDILGFSVATDGDTVLAGAPRSGTFDDGSVLVYRRPESGWIDATEDERIQPAPGRRSRFGDAVAMSGRFWVVGSHTERTAFVLDGLGLLFTDGFESGDASQWSATVP